MLPGMNPRQMRQAMKRMGIQQEEIDAEEVIIRCADKDIIIQNPSVQKVNMAGQKSFQITGEEIERERSQEIEISEEDIKTVMEQANVDKETAEKSIKDSNYDLAEAIMSLQE